MYLLALLMIQGTLDTTSHQQKLKNVCGARGAMSHSMSHDDISLEAFFGRLAVKMVAMTLYSNT